MRLSGTPIACASWFWLSPISFRNSCLRITPGCGFRSSSPRARSMVADDLDITCIPVHPHKTDPPLVVHADAHLSRPVSAQRLQSIARWIAQILQRPRGIELPQFTQRAVLKVPWKAPAHPTLPNAFRFPVLEGPDHK